MATANAGGSQFPANITFTGTQGDEAIARCEVTTAQPNDPVTYQFTTSRGPLVVRIGTTAGAQDILSEVTYRPGRHVFTITPGVGTYFIEWIYRGLSTAQLGDFQPLSVNALNLVNPWAGENLRGLRWAQSFNVIWYTNGTDVPQVFERRGENSWSIRDFLPDNGPFAPINLTTTTLTPSGREGTVTITASAATFGSYDAGALIRLTHPGQAVLETFAAVGDETDPILVTGIEDTRIFSIRLTNMAGNTVALERSVGNTLSYQEVESYTATDQVIQFNDEYENAVIYYRLRSTAGGTATVELVYGSGTTDGIARIISVDSDNTVTADVIEPFAKVEATTDWNHGAWSGRYGYPKAVALEDGRLWFFRDNEYWASASDDFENFAVGTLADEALNRTIGGLMNTAEWAMGADGKLLVGMRGGEASVGSSRFDEVIESSNVRARNRSSRGSKDHQAALYDDHAIFISRSAERLYRYGYNPDRGDYASFHLTRLNRDLGRDSKFTEVAIQHEPEPRIWVVREDGQLVVFAYDIEEGVLAPCRINIPKGSVQSVCILPGETEDIVYLCVRRTINGVAQQTIERLAPEWWQDSKDAWRLFGALKYEGTATNTFSGLDHLEGEQVYVWGDGAQMGPYTVTGGAVTTDEAVSTAIIGELYEGTYKSPRLRQGTLSAWKQVKRLALWLYRTAGGAVFYGDEEDDLECIEGVDEGYLLDDPVEIFSEDIEFPFEGGTERDPRVIIKMKGAGPATVLAMAPMVRNNER